MPTEQITSIDAQYLDCCLSDYFQGSNASEVLAIPVWHNITYKEAYEACKDEWNAGSSCEEFDVPDAGNMGEVAIHAMFTAMLAADPNDVCDFARYIEEVSEDDEDVETVYLYVGMFPEYQ